MNIIVRILTGVLQDLSPASNQYQKVTPVYVVLSVLSLAASLILLILFFLSKLPTGKFTTIYVDIGRLQWTRKQRLAKGNLINERMLVVGGGEADVGEEGRKMKKIGERWIEWQVQEEGAYRQAQAQEVETYIDDDYEYNNDY